MTKRIDFPQAKSNCIDHFRAKFLATLKERGITPTHRGVAIFAVLEGEIEDTTTYGDLVRTFGKRHNSLDSRIKDSDGDMRRDLRILKESLISARDKFLDEHKGIKMTTNFDRSR